MGVSRRSRVPERITRPDERFDSSQGGQSVPYCELFGGRFHYRPRQSRPSCQPRGFLSIPRPATRRPHLLNGAAPARSRIATGSALRATVVVRRFARLGLAACANEWHLNAAPHILRELYRQLQARSSPPGVHDTRATARATGHGSKDTATAQRPSSPTSGALPARGQHAQSPWSGPRAEDSLRVAKTSNRPPRQHRSPFGNHHTNLHRRLVGP